jgi:RNA polymerase sigma-70 factor (ECF subfamily)
MADVAPPDRARHARLRGLVDEHVDFVARTLRQGGVPRPDLDDEIQKTFIVVARRLEDVEIGSERSFLFQVAQHVASHARRKQARRREILDENPPERIDATATPELLMDRKQMRALLDDVIGSLPPSLRAVFTLFEFEDLNLTQISKVLAVPRGTVASRLRRARAQLQAHIANADIAGDLRADGAPEIAEPMRLRRERTSALQKALLAAGASARASPATYAKTLTALGFAPPAPLPSRRSRARAGAAARGVQRKA